MKHFLENIFYVITVNKTHQAKKEQRACINNRIMY